MTYMKGSLSSKIRAGNVILGGHRSKRKGRSCSRHLHWSRRLDRNFRPNRFLSMANSSVPSSISFIFLLLMTRGKCRCRIRIWRRHGRSGRGRNYIENKNSGRGHPHPHQGCINDPPRHLRWQAQMLKMT